MKGRTSGYSSDTEQNIKEDPSILRKPIFTALIGFLEAKKAYDNGTEEIRRLLSRECDIMYECKVCKNIFRSLTNFISHKRVYCRSLCNNFSQFNSNSNGFIDHDISTIIQAEQDYVNKSTTKDNKSNENSNKDLSSIIERLMKREQANRILKLTDFYEQVNNKLTQDEMLRKKHVLQLDRVPNSDVAVYQTIKKDDGDNIRKEVSEIHNLLQQDKTVLGPDGKVIEKPITSINMESVALKNVDDEHVTCDICKMEFTTEKTLKLHIQTKHITSTFVYQCPSCSQTFMQPGAVIRHLNNDHKKSLRRIRLMRESILKKRIRIDEVHVKGPSRELARLQTYKDKEKKDAEDRAWMDNIERAANSPMCTYCGKTFERKAVLTTHLNTCVMKSKSEMAMKKNEALSNNKIDDNLKNNDEQNDHDLTSNSTSKDSLKTKIESENKIASIDLTKDDPIKGRRRKPPKLLVKNEDKETESLDNLLFTFDTKEKLTLKTVSLDNLDKTNDAENQQTKPEKTSKSNSIKELSFLCKICEKRFDALSNLRRHISMFHYRRKKFGCKLCVYKAFRKYDVINHLNGVHALSGDKEFVLEFIITREDKTKKSEDIDDDVIVTKKLNVNGEPLAPQQTVEKRGRKPRATKEVKEQSIFTRSSSNLSLSSNEEALIPTLSKRPIRNRVKPVNKDFVYDLSNLLKKDVVISEKDYSTLPGKTQKRRNTTNVADDNSRDSAPSGNSSVDLDIKTSPKISVKGYALVMAQMAVSNFTACFNQPPEIPTERPVFPSRIPAQNQNDETSIENKSSKEECFEEQKTHKTHLRRVSDDSIIRNFSKRRKIDNESPLSDTTLNSSTKKDFNINNEKDIAPFSIIDGHETISEIDKIIVKCPTEKEFQEYLNTNKLTEPVKKINVNPFPETSFQDSTISAVKRVTLMQRLSDMRQKKLQDSLLRSALEN